MKNGKYVCFFISPIGAEGSEINERANDVYELIVQPAFLQCGVEVYRGDESASSNHIGADVIGCIREADLCIADISDLNCNVYYELGLADAMAKPVILLKEMSVDAARLPADVGSRKYVSYSVEGKQRRAAKQNLVDFVSSYIKELDAKPANSNAAIAQPKHTQELLEEIFTLRRQLEEKQASVPAQVSLPMDLRPKQLLPMEEAQKREITSQLEKLLSGKQAQIAAASEQIVALLHRLRSVIGDAEYLRVWLKRRSYMAPCIWNECLQYAAAWLDVDMAHTALDLTWLQPLLDGLEYNYDTPDQWPVLESIFERVLVISNASDDFSGKEFIMINNDGLSRHYGLADARYYRGMLAYYIYMRTNETDHLHDAAHHINRRSHFLDIIDKSATRTTSRIVEASLLFTEAYIRCNDKRAAAGTVRYILDLLEHAQYDVPALQSKLFKAYGLSLCCDASLAEDIAALMRTHTPEKIDELTK